ncbi:MAG TPA: SDR family NAD(P)-dependent oxidoreductase [Opitutaceae bacterium]|nr:SDR family NAD(P)-dependent oxidoreductase [Opitutaceae bacterium]
MAITTSSYEDLVGRVAVVTGASRGIGAGTARLLAQHGASVVVNGRDAEAISGVVASIRAEGGKAIGVIADVTDFGAIEALRKNAEAEFGAVDIVAAFAGGQGTPISIAELSPQSWHDTLSQNLTSTFLTLKAFLPEMIKRRRGAIVTMASTAGRAVSPASPAYGAAKAGVLMLTRQIALEVAQYGVRINAIAPGAVLDGKPLPDEMRNQIARVHPLGRVGSPLDIAHAALFLVSQASSWITGATIDVNGGRVML